MKRTGFARPQYEPAPRAPLQALVRQVNAGPSEREPVATEKERPRRNEQYRRWVAGLPCAHCCKLGPSQAAHADSGKGAGIKSGDDTCYPLCADGPGFLGCHSRVGASGLYNKELRRELESAFAAQVQRIAKASNQWPKDWE